MILSAFGEKFTRKTGILELMEDLAEAAKISAARSAAPLCMLGGGNPPASPRWNRCGEVGWRPSSPTPTASAA
jgi:valine--pyruvate aminotransferase